MLFQMPHPPLFFQIPDAWLQEAQVAGFVPTACCFAHTEPTVPDFLVRVPVAEITPMLRVPGVHAANHGFRPHGLDEQAGGMIGVLRAITVGLPLPPIIVNVLPRKSREGFVYMVRDGFHRYYASIALGFSQIPCTVQRDCQVE